MKRIGVEKGLSMVEEYLTGQGYTVQTLGEDVKDNVSKYDYLDAIVTADYNTNRIGYSDTSTKAPVINASGITPEEVKRMIDQKLGG
jgi:hypothetical protein